MIARLVSKAALIGGSIYLVTNTGVDDGLLAKRYSLPKKMLPKTINSLEDIELYEKQYGCKYIFVDRWGEQKIYSAKEFVNKSIPFPNDMLGKWENLIVDAADAQKNACEKRQNITLIYQSGKGFIPKT